MATAHSSIIYKISDTQIHSIKIIKINKPNTDNSVQNTELLV